MNLHRLLLERQEQDNPVGIGIIGCGKFASMFLAQANRTPGIHVAAIADLSPEHARASLRRVGWPEEQFAARDAGEAFRSRSAWITEDVESLFQQEQIDVAIDATGDTLAGVRHVMLACRYGKSIVMANVETDALAGPLLAQEARKAGVVYSLAYGDQPALICEQVDWARAAGFEVVAAGRGHKWLPEYQYATPDNVWKCYGLTHEQAKQGGMNPKMFTSFLDGTKPAIESTSVANATGLTPAPNGLDYPPARIDELPNICRPRSEGGKLHHKGQVEVISSLDGKGMQLDYDIRFGVFVSIEADSEYVARCFGEYGLQTDDSGRYATMYRRWHLIGLELGISIASVALRGEPTGVPNGWRADAIAVAKRNLHAGAMLDGEGGHDVSGVLAPSSLSMAKGTLPVGLTHGARLVNDVAKGRKILWSDVVVDENQPAVQLRREMQDTFRPNVPEGERRPRQLG